MRPPSYSSGSTEAVPGAAATFTLMVRRPGGTVCGRDPRDFMAANTIPSTPRSSSDSTALCSWRASPAVSAMSRKYPPARRGVQGAPQDAAGVPGDRDRVRDEPVRVGASRCAGCAPPGWGGSRARRRRRRCGRGPRREMRLLGWLLSTWETAPVETPARAATCARVTRGARPPGPSEVAGMAGSYVAAHPARAHTRTGSSCGTGARRRRADRRRRASTRPTQHEHEDAPAQSTGRPPSTRSRCT